MAKTLHHQLGFRMEVCGSHHLWRADSREHTVILRLHGAKRGETRWVQLEIWPKDALMPLVRNLGRGSTPREAIADAFDRFAFECLRKVWLFDALPEWVKELESRHD